MAKVLQVLTKLSACNSIMAGHYLVTMFYKGDNFGDFMFALPQALSERGDTFDRFSAIFLAFRPSCICASVCPLIFLNDFSSEAAEPILLTFHMEPP